MRFHAQQGFSLAELVVALIVIGIASVPVFALARYWQGQQSVQQLSAEITAYLDGARAAYRASCITGNWDLSVQGLIHNGYLASDVLHGSLVGKPQSVSVDYVGEARSRIVFTVSGLSPREQAVLSSHQRALRPEANSVVFHRSAGPMEQVQSMQYLEHNRQWGANAC